MHWLVQLFYYSKLSQGIFVIFSCFTIPGETGLGKSTLMDSLFNTSFESTPSPHNLATVKLKAHTYELQESNVRLKVKIIMMLKLMSIRFLFDILIRIKNKLERISLTCWDFCT